MCLDELVRKVFEAAPAGGTKRKSRPDMLCKDQIVDNISNLGIPVVATRKLSKITINAKIFVKVELQICS